MIFICLGTQIFPMNRVLIEIDNLIEKQLIKEEVFAQIGKSDYHPKHYSYKEFINPDEYDDIVKRSDLIVSHGGTGAIIKGLKANKQIIAIPRLKKYGEHEDDHQLQIVKFFYDGGYIEAVEEEKDLYVAIEKLRKNPIQKKYEGKGEIINIIDDYIKATFDLGK